MDPHQLDEDLDPMDPDPKIEIFKNSFFHKNYNAQ